MASVDIVVPNYNYGAYLSACVESVLSQTGVELRVLIVDNASTDDSPAIARRLAEDSRVELLLRNKNLGTHASFNAGIDWAQADYFLLLFSDDLLAPGALRRAVDVMERDPAIAFCYGRDIPLYGNAPAPAVPAQPFPAPATIHDGVSFIERFCRQGFFQIPGSSVIVRTAHQKRAGHYRTSLSHSDDYEIWLRLAMQGKVAELDCVQAVLRIHDANRSHALAGRQIEHIRHTLAAAESFFLHEGRRLHEAKRLRRLARHSLAHRAYWVGLSRLLRGQAEAGPLLKLAFTLDRSTLLLPPLFYLAQRRDLLGRLRRSLPGGLLDRH